MLLLNHMMLLTGYDNVEEVPLKLLEPSFGPVVRNKQQMMALQEEEMVITE